MRLEQLLEGAKSVALSGHIRPDGDCFGSCMGLYQYIRNSYPDIKVDVYLEAVPECFHMFPVVKEILHEVKDEVYDLFISLDCASVDRLGFSQCLFDSAKKTLCVDHHISNSGFACENYIVPEASSTSELVYNLIDKTAITTDIAECLYLGIVHDTGVFQYSCTSAKTMNNAGILMEKGIDYSKIVSDTFYLKTYDQNRILGYALLNSKLYLDGKVILTYLTKENLAEFHCTTKELDGIVNQLRVTKGTEVAVFLYESEDGSYKASFRVTGDVNVAEIAQVFGGGGHVKAAGCNIFGEIDEVIDQILGEIKKRL